MSSTSNRDSAPPPPPTRGKGKNRETTPDRNTREEEERKEEEARKRGAAAELREAELAAMSPEERKAREDAEEQNQRYAACLQEYEQEMAAEERAAAEMCTKARDLHLRVLAGTATDYDFADLADMLRQAESPDTKDVPDERIGPDDLSTDPGEPETSGKRKRKADGDRKPRKKAKEEDIEWFLAVETCENCHNHGIECEVAHDDNIRVCRECRRKKIKCPLMPESTVRRPKVKPARVKATKGKSSTTRGRTEPEIPISCQTRMDDIRDLLEETQQRVFRLEATRETDRKLMKLWARNTWRDRGEISSREYLEELDVSLHDTPPASAVDDIRKWIRRQKTTSIRDSEDTDDDRVDGKGDPESEDEPEDEEMPPAEDIGRPEEPEQPDAQGRTEAMEVDGPMYGPEPEPTRASAEVGPFVEVAPGEFVQPVPPEPKVKEERGAELGMSDAEYERHMLELSASRTKKKQEAAEKIEEAKKKAAALADHIRQLEVEKNALLENANAEAAKVKQEEEENRIPLVALPERSELEGYRLIRDINGQIVYEMLDDEEPVASGSGTQPEPEPKEQEESQAGGGEK